MLGLFVVCLVAIVAVVEIDARKAYLRGGASYNFDNGREFHLYDQNHLDTGKDLVIEDLQPGFGNGASYRPETFPGSSTRGSGSSGSSLGSGFGTSAPGGGGFGGSPR